MSNFLRTSALAAGLVLTSWAAAVELADDGVGDALIFPFFIADNGWDSYLNVQAAERRTATGAGLSLRVVLREGRDGAIIDSFNTYAIGTEAQSTWRAALYRNERGEARLRVAEGACLIDSAGRAHAGPGVELAVAATVGLVEVYSMAVPLGTSASEVGTPDCATLAANWQENTEGWLQDSELPDGRRLHASAISGQGALINVTQGLSGVYAATALRDFNGGAPLPQAAPGATAPTLADARASVVDGVLQPSGIAAVAGLLTTTSLSNDVIASDEVAASTEWLLSYPTSGYHAARPFEVMIDGALRNCSSFGVYGAADSSLPVVMMAPHAAERVFFSSAGDGSWQGAYGDHEFTPAPAPVEVGVALCNAVNVITFDGRPSMLLPAGSPHVEELTGLTGPSSHLWWAPAGAQGEPVLALRLTRFVNGTLAGGTVLSNYLFMDPHRRDVAVAELREPRTD